MMLAAHFLLLLPLPILAAMTGGGGAVQQAAAFLAIEEQQDPAASCWDQFDAGLKRQCMRGEWEEKFFFDSSTQSCQLFWYDGCPSALGSRNLFDSLLECKWLCEPGQQKAAGAAAVCLEPFDEHLRDECNEGSDWRRRFYFDRHKQRCVPFWWDGCPSADSGNQFLEEMDCVRQCEMPVAAESTTTTRTTTTTTTTTASPRQRQHHEEQQQTGVPPFAVPFAPAWRMRMVGGTRTTTAATSQPHSAAGANNNAIAMGGQQQQQQWHHHAPRQNVGEIRGGVLAGKSRWKSQQQQHSGGPVDTRQHWAQGQEGSKSNDNDNDNQYNWERGKKTTTEGTTTAAAGRRRTGETESTTGTMVPSTQRQQKWMGTAGGDHGGAAGRAGTRAQQLQYQQRHRQHQLQGRARTTTAMPMPMRTTAANGSGHWRTTTRRMGTQLPSADGIGIGRTGAMPLATTTTRPSGSDSTRPRPSLTHSPMESGDNVCQGPMDNNHYCLNNGTCEIDPGTGQPVCRCAPGFTNDNCGEPIDFDPCGSEPCLNGATCTASARPGGTRYDCFCARGYAGRHCELRPCDDNPCKNGGTCRTTRSAALFFCACAPGWAGNTCLIAIRPHGQEENASSALAALLPMLNASRQLSSGKAEWIEALRANMTTAQEGGEDQRSLPAELTRRSSSSSSAGGGRLPGQFIEEPVRSLKGGEGPPNDSSSHSPSTPAASSGAITEQQQQLIALMAFILLVCCCRCCCSSWV